MRKRAEELLIEGHRDRQVVALLERLASESEDSSEMALFAHRQLAELRLEASPWQAALHLRRLTEAGVQDDGVFALLGLCHALMGNFRTAVAAYRRALRTAAHNPWYHHNLGHLLDVGLGDARSALFHLREAHRLEPEEDEVTASLAHCLARLGELNEARALASRAVSRAAGNAEHEALLHWIESGAHDTSGLSPRRAHVRPGGSVTARAPRARTTAPNGNRPRSGGTPRSEERAVPAVEPRSRSARAKGNGNHGPRPDVGQGSQARAGASGQGELRGAVERLLRSHMPASGFSERDIAGAIALCADYCERSGVRQAKAEAVAAAIEYAFGRVLGHPVTQAGVGRRYGVGAGSLSSRYRLVQDELHLVPFDPRYVRPD